MLTQAMAELGVDQSVDIIDVETQDEVTKYHFLGSPTIRVNGLDVDEKVRERTNYSLACRIYQTDEGMQEWPSKTMVIKALEEARARESSPN